MTVSSPNQFKVLRLSHPRKLCRYCHHYCKAHLDVCHMEFALYKFIIIIIIIFSCGVTKKMQYD